MQSCSCPSRSIHRPTLRVQHGLPGLLGGLVETVVNLAFVRVLCHLPLGLIVDLALVRVLGQRLGFCRRPAVGTNLLFLGLWWWRRLKGRRDYRLHHLRRRQGRGGLAVGGNRRRRVGKLFGVRPLVRIEGLGRIHPPRHRHRRMLRFGRRILALAHQLHARFASGRQKACSCQLGWHKRRWRPIRLLLQGTLVRKLLRLRIRKLLRLPIRLQLREIRLLLLVGRVGRRSTSRSTVVRYCRTRILHDDRVGI
mmetsp:Transcript_34157/g.80095  ORF Transcript_34157/g.80095 Transcript_34157/m.80095 type:complete len:252 (-) Transcript_34157:2980-3735(-)